MIEKIFSSSFYLPVGRLFVNLLADRKVANSTPKYYLLAGDTSQASIFSPYIRYE